MNLFSFIHLIYKIKTGRINDIREIEKKGLLAVKIAQHLALRVDFFSPDLCQKLAKLFSQEFPHEIISIDKILDREYQEKFKHIDNVPIACASVGQIHKAEIEDGTFVTIKIIKDDFETKLKKDVQTLHTFFKFLTFFKPQLKNIFDPISIIEYIEKYSLYEIDLSHEIIGTRTLEELQLQASAFYNLKRLKFPKHFVELSSRKTLVTEYIEGTTIKTLLEQGRLPYSELLELFRIHGFFIFYLGQFHGDLHPGNVIWGEDKNFYFIDTATISSCSHEIKNHLLSFFFYLTEYNYEQAAQTLRLMSACEVSDQNFKNFLNNFLKLYHNFQGKTVSELSLTKQMMNSIKLAIQHKMSFDQSMFPIIKSLSYFDGMALKCNPRANLIEDMKPAITQLLKLK